MIGIIKRIGYTGVFWISITAQVYALNFDSLVISEFLASNANNLMDEDGDYSDWIEIFNPNTDTVNLLGWFLTDDPEDKDKWIFPQVKLAPYEYIVVFASGKHRFDPKKPLHTNFVLSSQGEYLALVKPDEHTVSSALDPSFPFQYEDISFALFENTYIFSDSLTPGEPNYLREFLPAPDFSVERGFYESPFQLELSTSVEYAAIFYTTNGTLPSMENGTLYTAPITINKTTPVRAISYKPGDNRCEVMTHTYLFIDDVINQPNDPDGYPSNWGHYAREEGWSIADYEMDPEVTENPEYANLLDDALLSIPSICITTMIGNLFSFDSSEITGGIYIYTGPPIDDILYGKGWERQASVEYIIPNDTSDFYINCGLRLHGGHSRLPEKNPKHSFRLMFKSKYGASRLNYSLFGDSATDDFNSLVLRGGFNNTWLHSEGGQRNRAQYIHDPWMKDTQREMGWISAHNKFAHLYLNGIYWGLYNISEKPDEEFFETYRGGDALDFDIMKDYAELQAGSDDIWDEMMSMANSGVSEDAKYQKMLGNNPDGTPNPSFPKLVNPESLIDYMLLNFYGGNTDWDNHNWLAACDRESGNKGYEFIVWDGEHVFEGLNHNMLGENNNDRPSRVFQKLCENEEFKIVLADRIQKHCFNGGVLTPESVADRFMQRANEIDLAIIAESARWGDYRRDVHQRSAPYKLYTKEDWLDEQNWLTETYFPQRTNVFIDQLIEANLFPSMDAPVFSQYGGEVEPGYELEITAAEGSIYYTLDGSDPRELGGIIASSAQIYTDEPVVLLSNKPVKARAKTGNIWSPLTEAFFDTGIPTHTVLRKSNSKFKIMGCYPNPVTDYAIIKYELPYHTMVEISIYAHDGKKVEHIILGYQDEGVHTVFWTPENLSNGLYTYKINIGRLSVNGKLLLNK